MSTPYSCRSITVYCSSSNHVHPSYLEMARLMGRLISENGFTLVYGGGKVGLMGELSAGAREAGGKVLGVILRKFQDLGVGDPEVREMIAYEDMRSRKRGLEEAGDAYIALPGGFGTFEEVTEMLSFKQLGFHNKPIVIVNANDYFGDLIRQFERGFAESFIEKRFTSLYHVVANPQEAITVIKDYQPPNLELKYRWPF
ncbi:MAG TPA: TIGR00730 family Rossman fold protein [bacterium]